VVKDVIFRLKSVPVDLASFLFSLHYCGLVLSLLFSEVMGSCSVQQAPLNVLWNY